MGFSYFEFKIRLIRPGISFPKQKFLYFNSQPTDPQSGVITITPKRQLLVGDTKSFQSVCLLKDFNTQEPITVSILNDSSWILLILLI